MLTKEQIKVVRSALVNNDDLYGESRCTALELAAAYERVTAWADSGALDSVITSRHLSPDVRDAVKGCRDEVRRALYGDADDKAGAVMPMTDEEAKNELRPFVLLADDQDRPFRAAIAHALLALADRKALVEAYDADIGVKVMDIDAARRHIKGEE